MRETKVGGLAEVVSCEGPSDLIATIEQEIIPRLVLAHRLDSTASCVDARPPPTADEIAAFGKLIVDQNTSAALATIDGFAHSGLTIESILIELIGKTARHLGDLWLEDRVSFVDVTTGLTTLQQIVNVLGPRLAPNVPHRGLVLLTAAPTEQHTLGLFLLGEFLRRAGWSVDVLPDMSLAELGAYLLRNDVDAIGFSVSREDLLPALARAVATVRRDAIKPGVRIMVGGRIELSTFAAEHSVKVLESPSWAVQWLGEHDAAKEPRNTSMTSGE
jgi:methanogenic corrinoid protein MtbC1